MKKLALFGSTGSIGKNTLEIIRKFPDKFLVEILVSGSNVELLAKQAKEFKPKIIIIKDESKYLKLKELVADTNIKVLAGIAAIEDIAKEKVDMAVMAIVGAAAIMPTINAIKAGSNIAIANKECLVCAGSIIMKLALESGCTIIPMDSEHTGLYQIFPFDKTTMLKEVIITASGGPFRDYSYEQLQNVTKQEALKHPNWEMGAKISIDSATMVNKCLEVIEACHLFALSSDKLNILIHPQSIIHAMVNFIDGSNLAQLSHTNMQVPISYALFYPDRAELPQFNNFSLAEFGKLTFEAPDKQKFRSLKLLPTILNNLDTNLPIIFNMANEIAVDAFLNDRIKFIQIIEFIEKLMDVIPMRKINSIEKVLEEIELVTEKSREFF